MKRIYLSLTFVFYVISLFSQGTITGIKQDWSLHRSTMNSNFDTLFKERKYINVSEFGAVGDGVTNDSAAIQDAFIFAYNNDLNVLFEKNKHYICSGRRIYFNGGEIDFNGSTLEFTYNGTAASYGLQLTGGQSGTFYNSDYDIAIGDNEIYVSDANFFTGLRAGDIINIRSSLVFNTESTETTSVQGELIKVLSVDSAAGKFYSVSKFDDNYLVSDGAEVSKITSRKIILRNGTIKQNGNKVITGAADANWGVVASYVNGLIIENINIINARYAGISSFICYSPSFYNIVAEGANLNGAGYGIQIYDAVKGAYINNLRAYGIRHAISHSGGTHGVPWNTIATNCIGYSEFGVHVFDSHAAVGRVTFENCHAYLGVLTTDTADFKGVWNASTSYLTGNIVQFNTALYEATAGSTGLNPETSTNWGRYDNSSAGFVMHGRYSVIKNCHVYNASRMYTQSLNVENLVIDGLYGENIGYGIQLQTGKSLTKSYINNVYVKNTAKKSTDYLLRVVTANFDSTYIGNLSGVNTGGLNLYNLTGDLNIDNITCSGRIMDMDAFSTSVNININNLNFTDTENETTLICRLDQSNLHSFSIGNLVAKNTGYGYLFNIAANLTNFFIGNANLQVESTNSMILVNSSITVTNIALGDLKNIGSGSGRVVVNSGTITNYKSGTLSGTWLYEISTNQPTLEIIQGEFGAPHISRGAGSPESVVTADPGSVYYNRSGGASTTLYVKESGTGNTGWIAK